jgi:hypothetical protein
MYLGRHQEKDVLFLGRVVLGGMIVRTLSGLYQRLPLDQTVRHKELTKPCKLIN